MDPKEQIADLIARNEELILKVAQLEESHNLICELFGNMRNELNEMASEVFVEFNATRAVQAAQEK